MPVVVPRDSRGDRAEIICRKVVLTYSAFVALDFLVAVENADRRGVLGLCNGSGETERSDDGQHKQAALQGE